MIANSIGLKFYSAFCMLTLGIFTVLSLAFYPVFYFFHHNNVFLFFGKIRSLMKGNIYFLALVIKLVLSAIIHAAFKSLQRVLALFALECLFFAIISFTLIFDTHKEMLFMFSQLFCQVLRILLLVVFYVKI